MDDDDDDHYYFYHTPSLKTLSLFSNILCTFKIQDLESIDGHLYWLVR